MSNEYPEGWNEPVNEVLMCPPTFYGAAPRKPVLSMYIVGLLGTVLLAMSKGVLVVPVPMLIIVAVHIGLAVLTRHEPLWYEMLVEWMRSPQSRVDP